MAPKLSLVKYQTRLRQKKTNNNKKKITALLRNTISTDLDVQTERQQILIYLFFLQNC